MMRRRRFNAALGAGMLPGLAAAQPAEPLRLLIGFPAGTVDLVARLLAERLAPLLQRPVLVDARPGASGRFAPQALKAARPDGHALLLVPHGAVTLFPQVFRPLGYDPATDLVPLAQVAVLEFVLCVSNEVPADELRQLTTWLRHQPHAMACATPGIGTAPHFLMARYAALGGVQLTHVPYKSPAEVLAALVGRHVPLAVMPLPDVQEAAQAGRLKLLATFGARRWPLMPALPTVREAGIDLAVSGWLGLYARAGTPGEVLAAQHEAVAQVLARPELRARLQLAGLRVGSLDGPGLARLQAQESAFWADTVRRTGFAPVAGA